MKSKTRVVLAAAAAIALGSAPALAQGQKFEITLNKDGWHVGKVNNLSLTAAEHCKKRGGKLEVDDTSKECKQIPALTKGGKPGMNCPNVCVVASQTPAATPDKAPAETPSEN